MRKLILVFMILAALLSAATACTKKAADKPKSASSSDADITHSDTIPADVTKSDLSTSSDVTPSTDVQSSDTTEEISLQGSWQSDDAAVTITFLTDAGECIYSEGDINYICSYTYEDDVITIPQHMTCTIAQHSKSKLVLTADDGEEKTYKKLSIKKGLQGLTNEQLCGTWICHIKDATGDLQFEYTLFEDMTASFVINTNGKADSLRDITWKITKKGMLILDNGTDTDSSQLRYRIVGSTNEGNTLFIVTEKTVLCMYKVK